MPKPKPEKKSKLAVPAGRGVPSMELQVGDRLADDETGVWEVIAAPYSTAGGRIVHAHQRGASDHRGGPAMIVDCVGLA
jgi:hypothetical protein